MNISDWLDEKEAESLTYPTFHCPTTCSYDSTPTKRFFSWRSIRAESFLPAIIRSQLSSGLDTGIIAEVATRNRVFTRQEWSGVVYQG